MTRYARRVKHWLIPFIVLEGCSTSGSLTVPTQSTVEGIESGLQLVRDLEVVGAAVEPSELNAQSRVRVRRVACVSLGANLAQCAYEVNRCTEGERDNDADGWCQRTSRFIRTRYIRGPFDVIVGGWAREAAHP